ncbi:MAG: hypothetical protein Q4D38_05780 [Planctomycetia bacterium]|nr:hypothetical protein [Planctomycetia bacterium]
MLPTRLTLLAIQLSVCLHRQQLVVIILLVEISGAVRRWSLRTTARKATRKTGILKENGYNQFFRISYGFDRPDFNINFEGSSKSTNCHIDNFDGGFPSNLIFTFVNDNIFRMLIIGLNNTPFGSF